MTTAAMARLHAELLRLAREATADANARARGKHALAHYDDGRASAYRHAAKLLLAAAGGGAP